MQSKVEIISAWYIVGPQQIFADFLTSWPTRFLLAKESLEKVENNEKTKLSYK